MTQVNLTSSNLSTQHVDLLEGRYLVRAFSSNWSGVTATPKALIDATQVALKDVLGNTISFTANGYFIFEYVGRITFAGTVGTGKSVNLEFIRL